MKTIGIDIGTTSVGGVVYDDEKGVLETVTREHHASLDTPDPWEHMQNPLVLVTVAKTMLDELLERHNGIERIGLTGQMHGIVYLDSEGEAVSPLYTWQDERGAVVFEKESLVDRLNRDGGSKVSSGYGLVTHIFNTEYQCCPLEAVSLATIMDYFGMVLTGRKAPLVHCSNAASFGFWNVQDNCFETERLQGYGVYPEILPEVTCEIEELGNYRGVSVTCAIGDNQASYLGAVGFREDAVLLNVGTGSQVSLLSETYQEFEGIDTRPFLNGKYLLVGASLCGGRVYAMLEHFFREYVKEAAGVDREQYEVMERLAREASPGSLTVCTEVNGNRMDPMKRGSITEISEENFHAGNLIYAFEEGMIRELYGYYRRMQGNAVRLFGSGNGLRKNVVLQNIAERMFGLQMEMNTEKEEAACGAAKAAAVFGCVGKIVG